MRIFAAAVFALLLVAALALPVRAQLPGRQSTPTPDVDDGGWITLGILQRHEDTGALRLLPVAAEAPTATHTPQPPTATRTPTPSPTLTATPTATVTPSATPGQGEPPTATPSATPPPASATPTPTATVTPGDVEPTPTPETAEPPPTFTLTPVPDKVCVIKTGAFGINERSDHDTGAPRVDVIPAGSIVTIEEFWQGNTYLWARSAIGWFVVREGSTWWVYGLEGTELCDEVQGWPTGLTPPPPVALEPRPPRNPIGLHMIWGTDIRAVEEEYLRPLAAAGLCPSTMKVMDLVEYAIPRVRMICPDTVVIYRTQVCGDYPRWDQSPEVAAEQFYACARGRWLLSGADLYEPINESPAPTAWKARFSLRLLELGTRDGLSLVVPGDGPGNPEVVDYASEYTKLYTYILAHPDAGHAISTHAYGIDRYLSDSGAWLGFRHRLFYEVMRTQVERAAWVPVYLTEIGPYGMFRGDPITCTGLADDMARYAVELRSDPYVRGAHLFTTGSGGGEWYAVDGCLAAIADALRRVLG